MWRKVNVEVREGEAWWNGLLEGIALQSVDLAIEPLLGATPARQMGFRGAST